MDPKEKAQGYKGSIQFSPTTIWNLLNGQKDDGYLNSHKESEENFKGVLSLLSSEAGLQ